MLNKRRAAGVLMALALCGAKGAGAVEYAPILNASLLGGQYWFQGANANLSANASLTAASAVKANEAWSVLPMFVGNYQGTKGVQDAVPAGTLFQQEMDYRGSMTGIRQEPGSQWKLKPSASYKYEFLKQTSDETWGHGLFDYEKIGSGFEAEKVYNDPFSYRLGADFYRIRFRNYQSLESQTPVDPLGAPLNRTGFNSSILDTYNFQLSASGSRPYPFDDPTVSLEGGYSLLYQSYIDQNLIDETDAVRGGGRVDWLQSWNGGVTYPKKVEWFGGERRLSAKLGVNFAYNGSNQNFFDATTTQFFADAYSYWSYGLVPSVSLSWGDGKHPATVGTSLSYNRVKYFNRQAENGDGVYTGEHLWQAFYVYSLSGAYPIAPQVYLRAQMNFLWARSNNTFETTYAYNYRTANYLMGFSYEY